MIGGCPFRASANHGERHSYSNILLQEVKLDVYSPRGVRSLFDGKRIDHLLDFNIEEFRCATIASVLDKSGNVEFFMYTK